VGVQNLLDRRDSKLYKNYAHFEIDN